VKYKWLIVTAALSGCAPTVWDKPGGTQADFNEDTARCQLVAEGMSPDFGSPVYLTGHAGRDIADNEISAFVHGVDRGMAVGHTHALCMQANGYTARVAGAVPTGVPFLIPGTDTPLWQ
jgi:hypothetical protein